MLKGPGLGKGPAIGTHTIHIHFILMDLFIIKWSGICLKLFNDRIKFFFIVRLN